MNPTQVFQVVATGLGLVGVISAAAVVMRSSIITQNNTQLRNAYKDTREQLADREKELAAKTAEALTLSSRIDVLEGIVTGRTELEQLTGEVRTLTGIVRTDYQHLAPALEFMIQEMIRRGVDPGSDLKARPAPRPKPRPRPVQRGGPDA